MNRNYSLLFSIILPIIFILMNWGFVHYVNKKLHYKNDVALNSEGIHNGRNKTFKVCFTTEDNVEFERVYSGFLTRNYAKKYSDKLKNNILLVSFYAFDIDENHENPFFNLGQGKEKAISYYFDILSYVKQKYWVCFWGFLVFAIILLKMEKTKAESYSKVIASICSLTLLYLLL